MSPATVGCVLTAARICPLSCAVLSDLCWRRRRPSEPSSVRSWFTEPPQISLAGVHQVLGEAVRHAEIDSEDRIRRLDADRAAPLTILEAGQLLLRGADENVSLPPLLRSMSVWMLMVFSDPRRCLLPFPYSAGGRCSAGVAGWPMFPHPEYG